MTAPIPTAIRLHQKSRELELQYADQTYRLPCEFLRVFSPSAEVKGHGAGQEVLQTGKRMVNIQQIESVGHYAIQLFFTDKHNTGIFSWEYLYELCQNQEAYWQDYLERLAKAGASRDPLFIHIG